MLAAGLRLDRRVRAEQVVGLVVVALRDVPAERLVQVGRSLPLRRELVGHRRPVGVVAVEQLDAVLGGVDAEAHDHRARLVQLDLAQHDVDRAEQRVDRPPVVVGDRLRQRVERPVQERGSVDDEQRACHARRLCER